MAYGLAADFKFVEAVIAVAEQIFVQYGSFKRGDFFIFLFK